MTQLAKSKFLFLKYSFELSLYVHKLARRNKSTCIQIDNKATVVYLYSLFLLWKIKKSRSKQNESWKIYYLSITTNAHFTHYEKIIFSLDQQHLVITNKLKTHANKLIYTLFYKNQFLYLSINKFHGIFLIVLNYKFVCYTSRDCEAK